MCLHSVLLLSAPSPPLFHSNQRLYEFVAQLGSQWHSNWIWWEAQHFWLQADSRNMFFLQLLKNTRKNDRRNVNRLSPKRLYTISRCVCDLAVFMCRNVCKMNCVYNRWEENTARVCPDPKLILYFLLHQTFTVRRLLWHYIEMLSIAFIDKCFTWFVRVSRSHENTKGYITETWQTNNILCLILQKCNILHLLVELQTQFIFDFTANNERKLEATIIATIW